MVVSNGGSSFLGKEIPLPAFYLNLTFFLPQFNLFLTSFLPS